MKQKTLLYQLMLLVCLLVGGSTSAWATVVTYTVASTTSVNTSGTAPTGSEASFENTYTNNKVQITSGNTQTLTLSNYSGYKITQIKLSMHSNQSSGSGKLSYSTDNGSSWTYLVGTSTSGVAFNDNAWYGGWSTDFVDVTKNVNITCSTSNFKIKIESTNKSLYCQSYQLTYEAVDNTNYTITIDSEHIAHGSVEASASSAKSGTEITLTPTADDGYKLSAWDVRDGSSNSITVTNNKFTMPSSNVTVGATFSLLRAITVNEAEHGSMVANPTSAVIGETVTLTATPDENYELSGVTVTNSSTSAAIATSGTGNTRTFTMPDAAVSVTPVFTMQKGIQQNPYTVAEVTSYITGGGTGNKYTRGIVSQAGTSVSSGKMTYYISDDGTTTNQLMIYSGKNLGDTDFSATSDLKVGDRVVVYGPVTYYLSTTPEYTTGNYVYSLSRDFTFYLDDLSNGSVAIQVNGVNQVPNVDGEVTIASGATVTLTATPASGYTFANWTCDDATYNNSITNPLEFEMPFDDIMFGASFLDANAEYDIVVDDNITGGSIESDVDQAKAGDTVTLTATPDENYVFGAWDVQDGSSNTVTVTNNKFTMPASDVTVTATFKKVHTVTYYINGVENSTTRVDGEELNLDAPAASAFAGWSSANSAANPVFVANDAEVTSDLTLYAIFIANRSVSDEYVKITNVNDVTAGQYLIVNETNTAAFNASNSTLDATGNDITVSISNSKISVTNNTKAAEVTIEPMTGGYSIKTPTVYIGRSGTTNGMDQDEDPLVNTITFSNNNAVIKGSGGVQFQLWKSGTNMCFKYYASSQSAVQLYKKPVVTTYSLSEYEAINVSAAGWATYATKSAVEFTEGDAYVVSAAGETTTLKSVTQVPAGTPVLMKGTSGTAVVKYAEVLSTTPAAPASNLLKVSDGTIQGDDANIYVLARKNDVTGFYLWSSTADPIPSGKVYLDTTGVGAKGIEYFSLDDSVIEESETNGINAATVEGIMNGQFYNLAGQKVDATYKGIVIVNGKKYVRK